MQTNTQVRLSKLLRAVLTMSCLLLAGTGHAEGAVAGVIKKKEGNVEIVRGGKSMPAEVGATIQAGDVFKWEPIGS